MELNNAASVDEALEITRSECHRIVPFDVFIYLNLPKLGAKIPENPINHNASFLDNFWRDYREGCFYKDDPAIPVFAMPGVKNIPFRANRGPNFHETPIYRELLKKYDINMYMAMRIEFNREKRVLGLGQVAGSRAYTQEDENALGFLAPQLSKAIEHCELLDKMRSESASPALSDGQIAVWRLTQNLEITDTNAPADKLMAKWKLAGIFHEVAGQASSLPRAVMELLTSARNLWSAGVRSGSFSTPSPTRRITVNVSGEVFDFQVAVTTPVRNGSGASFTLIAERNSEVLDYKPFRANRLTGREKEIAMLVREGHSNRVISEILSVSEQTVKQHVSSALKKLGVKNRAGMIHKLYGQPGN